ncbi:hypothetical protein Bca52824_018422 [Brassica carinata]|uniref:Uncharacterized protein n=1 Tax=Brassica carinata TaxID=52824 RepID=A0A8X7VQW5_BRACI|nr:hypothetical protein Bca52824_018422 [Brassica carinata]
MENKRKSKSRSPPARTARGGAFRRPEAAPSLFSAPFSFASSSTLSLSLPCLGFCIWRLGGFNLRCREALFRRCSARFGCAWRRCRLTSLLWRVVLMALLAGGERRVEVVRWFLLGVSGELLLFIDSLDCSGGSSNSEGSLLSLTASACWGYGVGSWSVT